MWTSKESVKAILAGVENTISATCRMAVGISLCSMLATMLCSVVLRYLQTGLRLTTWFSELPELLFPWLIAAGIVLAAQRGAHLSIAFFTKMFKGMAFSLALGFRLWCVTAVYSILCWEIGQVLDIVAQERSAILGISQGWAWAALLAGFALLVFSEWVIFLRYLLWGVSPISSLAPEAA